MSYIKDPFELICLFVASLVYAHGGATGIVKERMDAMTDMGEKTKSVADMVKGKREFDRAAVIDAADTFTLHGESMAKLFPDTEMSRTGSETEALPLIWEEWDAFTMQINEFVALSEELKQSALQTDDIPTLRRAFFKATKGCSACHKRFRKPKG